MDAQNCAQMSAQDPSRSTAEQRPRIRTDEGMWKKFAEPHGWALKWDGFGLSEIGERQNGCVLPPAVEARHDGD